MPLEEPISSRGASVLARRVAQQLEKTMPKLVTATMTQKSARGARCSWTGARTTEPRPRSRRIHFAAGSFRPSRHLVPGTRSTTPNCGICGLTRCLERVEKDGDLLAELDESLPTDDRLTKYRSMRDASKTPEPVPKKTPKTGDDNLFVIQEHHARRLHYDLRLERNGVLVSWAVPKNLPDTPAVNHLAVHTEDHPLEYLAFHGSIPKGEYGAGEMIVWDTGTYETEKFNDVPPDGAAKGGEVIVTLHGNKIEGRYALIQTDGKNWLAHRMKEQQRPQAGDLAPMLATEGSVQNPQGIAVGVRGKVGWLSRHRRSEPWSAEPALAAWPRRHP